MSYVSEVARISKCCTMDRATSESHAQAAGKLCRGLA